MVASRNHGKVAELQRLLTGVPWRLLELDQAPGGAGIEWAEDGSDYCANASIKARAVCVATGLPALGDDSGIEVRGLDGWPGLQTARWLGEGATPEQLLRGLAERISILPDASRQASFVCALALALPAPGSEPQTIVAQARLEGSLVTEPRGGRGFGYDPIFIPVGDQRTMAEMSQAHKDEISHRGIAVRQLLSRLG